MFLRSLDVLSPGCAAVTVPKSVVAADGRAWQIAATGPFLGDILLSQITRLVAWFAFLFGLLRLVLGFAIANDLLGSYEQVMRRSGVISASYSDMIEQALIIIVVALALGTLADIARAVRQGRSGGGREAH